MFIHSLLQGLHGILHLRRDILVPLFIPGPDYYQSELGDPVLENSGLISGVFHALCLTSSSANRFILIKDPNKTDLHSSDELQGHSNYGSNTRRVGQH